MIRDNISTIHEKIRRQAVQCGRSPDSVRLVAVSKRFPAASIREAMEAGQLIFGENYIQEAQQKHAELGEDVSFHFIGHLQSNKAKIAAQICTMIETVDRAKLARELNKHLVTLDRHLDILVQVNIGEDSNKSGVDAENTESLLVAIGELPMLRARGLMTMPPFTPDPEDARPYFRMMRELADKLQKKKLFYDNSFVELSMGMTNDYLVAIEEGATLVRIGTAIFGERQPLKQ